MITRYVIKLSIALFVATTALSMDNFHFYRPPFFGITFGEPRLVEPLLSSLDILFGGGKTHCARGFCCQKETCLLDLYGPYNMHLLGSNVPGKNPATQEDSALIELARTPGRECTFGYLRYQGKFKLFETQILFTQNFRHGLFAQLSLPVRYMALSNVCYQDLTPQGCPCPDIDTHAWQTFLDLYDTILNKYNLYTGGYKKIRLGDLSFLVGFGGNYQDMRVLDYVDLDIKLGMMFPTGDRTDVNSAFDIPSGYNGHVGFGGTFDIAIGVYNWLTFGGYGGSIVFTDKTRMMRIKTDERQNGLIKLAKTCATVKQGPIWYTGAFGKLDHIAGGFSVLAGYSYSAQGKTTIYPENSCYCNPHAVQCDTTLRGWDMHVLHLIADYDCAQVSDQVSPRVGFFANIIMGGEHIFKTQMIGGAFGLDISTQF